MAASIRATDRVRVGTTTLEVSRLVMGTSRLGAFWQRRSPLDGARAVARALELGINGFETADCYGRGLAERIIGHGVRARRDDVVLCTKVGLIKTPPAMLSARQTSGRCFEPEYLRTAVRRSLRRFRTDTIDLLMLHEPPLDVIQRGDAMATLTELQSAGDARHVGVCTLEVDVGRAAVEAAGVECIEVPFDVCHRAFADDVIPAAVERGIGVLTVAPLGDGRLVAELPGLTADAAASACLRAALDVPGVAATVVGMNRAEHVPRNVDAIATMPPVDAVERLRAAHCPDRDRDRG